MKIFSAAQIKRWDKFTIENDPVSSIDLMEHAAAACCNWLIGKNFGKFHFRIFCGKGNNGGDGLAIARMLKISGHGVAVYLSESTGTDSTEFSINLERYHDCGGEIYGFQSNGILPVIQKDDVIVDAIFGTGLNKPPTGIHAALINYMNQSGDTIISIDIPSGLYADACSKKNSIVNATHTLSFQNPKLAFFVAENEKYVGDVHLLDIGLHQQFELQEGSVFETIEKEMVNLILHPRGKFSHKGNYGHAAILAGSKGMMGAAVLAARGCLRSGVGKLTCYLPACGLNIMQTAAPEAMCKVSGNDHLETVNGLGSYNAVGIGPGIGTENNMIGLLNQLFSFPEIRLVIDADALNVMAADKALMNIIPPGSILTPHTREFERLFGESANDFNRIQLALQKAVEHRIYIVLKGHHTLICTPEGKGYFNTTGNPGMATGGSGDVLCGVLTGLLAQGYTPLHASLIGVYLHGLAGDIAAEKRSEEAMVAGDIVECLGEAFRNMVG